MSDLSTVTVSTSGITEQQRADALRRVNRRKVGLWRYVWEWVKSLQLAILVFLLVRALLFEAFKIPSGSMEGTLQVGDFLLVNKVVYGATVPFTGLRLPAVREPERGDVVVFQYPLDPTKNFVKRLVGLPGDTLAMTNGLLRRNGRDLDEPYARHIDPQGDPRSEDFRWQRDFLVRSAQAAVAYHPSRNNWGPIVVPSHHYFMLGDNRDNSQDSRYWGFVADSLVRGTPMFVYFSYAPDSAAHTPLLPRIRWQRLGTRIQ
ncbi:MAG: Signal peptidase I [Gemmatimonadaceae bacterium]|nr:Signal peptidase I [Gemmatimonadaceae bacterium]